MLQKSHSNIADDPSLNLMTLKRMGARYASRLSFSRSMLRTIVKEKWNIKRIRFDLDSQGYGIAIYEVKIIKKTFSLICFSQHINDSERSDRVIADTWDTAYVLHIGKISHNDIKRLKKKYPSSGGWSQFS